MGLLCETEEHGFRQKDKETYLFNDIGFGDMVIEEYRDSNIVLDGRMLKNFEVLATYFPSITSLCLVILYSK